MDLLLDPATHDLDVIAYKMRYTSGVLETTRQELAITLQTFLEEWFLDQQIGLPYYRDILVKNPNLEIIRGIFRKAILSNPNVEAVPRLDLDFDNETRILRLDFDADLIDDTILTLSLPSESVEEEEELFSDPLPVLF